MQTIRIGSRKSKLALWQAEKVAGMLNQEGMATEIVTMETRGDKILNRPIAKIGSKGVFTEEIEAMLREGEVDLAVHSAKDMPSILPGGFGLIAFTRREKPHDVLVSFDSALDLENHEIPIRIGTSSVRRVAMLRHFHPHVRTVDMRGNLQTRIQKMKSGACDALMLAFAGVTRMGFDRLIAREMPPADFVPPVGQGSIAVEVFESMDPGLAQKIRQAANHPPTESAISAERAYLKELQGGCSIPAFALGECRGGMIRLTAGLISLDGRRMLKEIETGDARHAADLGRRAGLKILDGGGREILKEIKTLDPP